jgi:AraC-like DNA-binding protein
MCVTHSDVQVLQPYETTSRHDSPLYMLVVLEGCVILTLNGQEHVVRSGMAFSSRLSEHQTMRARHHADCKLRTLSLGLYPDGACRTGLLESLMREWERCQTPTLIWQVPGFLLSGLQYAQQSTISHISRQLMLEGLILQLFGHGLSVCQVESGKRLAASGEQQRLEVVRRLLEQSPEKDYTLNELAQRAAMSPSSLRSKFRAAYGCSVFDYLRDCRLERARGYLLEGYSVQQAAWMSGYQHATNFSTAFRRRYGFSPGDLLKLC